MGLALLFVIWLITFISTYFFIAKTWWLPVGASTWAAPIDAQFKFTYLTMGIVFVAAQLALGLFAWKYRDRGHTAAHYTHGNVRLEAVWTVLTAILFIGLNLMGEPTWAQQRFMGPSPGALQVEVTGVQFVWYFRYPGPDGKFGRTRADLIDASAGSDAAVGLDTDDPAAKDDIVTGTLVLPVNREIDVTLRAQDVIHDFFVREMRFKQDAVPGLNIHVHFTPTQTGKYEVACAELCGLGHYKMRAALLVVSDAEYQKWLAERQAEKQ